MKNNQILDIAQIHMKHYITKNDTVIDMTMGNGQDTLLLAEISKFVYAFDIQEIALTNTKVKMRASGLSNYKLILDNHVNVLNHVHNFRYVVYNLGYLPGGDKAITTKNTETIKSLSTVLEQLDSGGMVFMVVYRGHSEGYQESKDLDIYLQTLNQHKYKVLKTYLPYQDNRPPYVLTIYKKELINKE